MRTRRELLILGGAGAAAIAVPAFLPFRSNTTTALAQGSAGLDPLLAEITNQFRRLNAGLAASPPRGNAQQIAATFRMMAAWGKANNLDAQLKQAVTEAVALDGHDNLVAKLSSFDYVADAKARGIALPPTFRNPTFVDVARAIGVVKAGFSFENELRRRAWKIGKKAAEFNRQMAILNRVEPDAVILRVQSGSGCPDDIDCDGVPNSIDPTDDREPFDVEGECLQNPDGSWHCNLVATPIEDGCDEGVIAALILTVFLSMLCLVVPAFCAGAIVMEGLWGFTLWYMGCL